MEKLKLHIYKSKQEVREPDKIDNNCVLNIKLILIKATGVSASMEEDNEEFLNHRRRKYQQMYSLKQTEGEATNLNCSRSL